MRDDRVSALGPQHPYTLWAINNLANSYHDAGRRDEALTMVEEMLILRRKFCEPEHFDTLKTMINLAVSYDKSGRKDEAVSQRRWHVEYAGHRAVPKRSMC